MISFKADSHSLQRSAFSAVDCVNTEIENFLTLCGNANVHCGICTSVNESLTIWIASMQHKSNATLKSVYDIGSRLKLQFILCKIVWKERKYMFGILYEVMVLCYFTYLIFDTFKKV